MSIQVQQNHTFGDVTPSLLDRAYYPRLKDIRWHVFSASRALSLSKIDQVCTLLRTTSMFDTTINCYPHCVLLSTVSARGSLSYYLEYGCKG